MGDTSPPAFLRPVAVTYGRSRGDTTTLPSVAVSCWGAGLGGGLGGTYGWPLEGGFTPQSGAFSTKLSLMSGISFGASGGGSITFASTVQSGSSETSSRTEEIFPVLVSVAVLGGRVLVTGVSFCAASKTMKSLRLMWSGSTNSSRGPGFIAPFSFRVTPVCTFMVSISEGVGSLSALRYSNGASASAFFLFFFLSFLSSCFFLFLGSAAASASNSAAVFITLTAGPKEYCGSFSGSTLLSMITLPLWS
mmetsp:Transcript_3042/g.6312  ORF Transcript_3042/g.6312 Transcript_3042/m.6312 type:complete len:249 (+) Transcript_3042:201-947(+)